MSDFWMCDDCGESVNCHDDNHDCPGSPLTAGEVENIVERIVSERLRRIADRLRVSADGPLVPEAEVYVRNLLARAIVEELEER